jgi:hypothetical protein
MPTTKRCFSPVPLVGLILGGISDWLGKGQAAGFRFHPWGFQGSALRTRPFQGLPAHRDFSTRWEKVIFQTMLSLGTPRKTSAKQGHLKRLRVAATAPAGSPKGATPDAGVPMPTGHCGPGRGLLRLHRNCQFRTKSEQTKTEYRYRAALPEATPPNSSTIRDGTLHGHCDCCPAPLMPSANLGNQSAFSTTSVLVACRQQTL